MAGMNRGRFVEMKCSPNITQRRYPTKVFWLSVVVILVSGCAATAPVRVLPKGTTDVVASLGGPIVVNTSPIGVIPYATVGLMHGISNDVTVHGSAHLTMAAFGVAGVDVGASARAWSQDGAIPEATLAARFMAMTDFGDWTTTRVWPTTSATFSWGNDDCMLYTGGHTTLELVDGSVIASPFLGVQFAASSTLWFQVEGIWQAANRNTRNGVFEGQSSIGGMGSFGCFVAGRIRL